MPAMPQSTCRPRSVATPPRCGATTASSRPGLEGRFVARRPDRGDTACTEAHHAVHIVDLPCGSTRSSPTPSPVGRVQAKGIRTCWRAPRQERSHVLAEGSRRCRTRPRARALYRCGRRSRTRASTWTATPSGADRTLGVDRVSRPRLAPIPQMVAGSRRAGGRAGDSVPARQAGRASRSARHHPRSNCRLRAVRDPRAR